jgi:hypothetical protein
MAHLTTRYSTGSTDAYRDFAVRRSVVICQLWTPMAGSSAYSRCEDIIKTCPSAIATSSVSSTGDDVHCQMGWQLERCDRQEAAKARRSPPIGLTYTIPPATETALAQSSIPWPAATRVGVQLLAPQGPENLQSPLSLTMIAVPPISAGRREHVRDLESPSQMKTSTLANILRRLSHTLRRRRRPVLDAKG